MIEWKIATLKKSEQAAVNVKSLVFYVPGEKHQAGQHYNIRLTAEDGYQAERDYSAANAPEDQDSIEFGVQLLEDGEVSPYLWQLAAGDQVEVRGPIGLHFVWDIAMEGPLCLIGGGSGMVPLMSMLRHHFRNSERDHDRKIIFLVSARTFDHVLYREELERYAGEDPNFKLVVTLTQEAPPDWSGYRRLIDRDMIADVFGGAKEGRYYICGPTPFVEVAAGILAASGVSRERIKTERFGSSDKDA